MQRTMLGLFFYLALIVGLCGYAFASEKAVDKTPPGPVTVVDPGIPVDELELLLKPLTKSQLLIEAEAWQTIVQKKAEQISKAEITIKRQNQEIEKAEQIKEAASKAKQRLETVKALTEEASRTGEAEAMAKADDAAKKVQEQMDQVRTSVDEASKAAEKTAEIQEQMPDNVKRTLAETADAAVTAEQALEKVGRTVEDAKGKTGDALRAAADQARQATDQAVEATRTVEDRAADAADATRRAAMAEETKASLNATESNLDNAKEKKEAQKVQLLEAIAELRKERTGLLDQFKAVVTALEAKTDENDADTLAKISDYKLYASAVSGIQVDVKDATSSWLAIKTWLMSEEGGQRWGINLMTFFGILTVTWVVSGIFSRLWHNNPVTPCA